MTEPEDELIGKILLGKLEVIRRLGGGGMGVVYEVEHRLTGHRRALKVVQSRYADRPRFMKRLLREAKVAGTLGTPYVVETFDAGRLEDGSAYVLMELLEGKTLYEAMQEEGRLGPRRVANVMAQVAEGMAVAHEAGIVHRDLKPENIFLVVDEDGEERVKILDFGVSKFEAVAGEEPSRLTAEGTLVGTPYYMSPEQAGGKKVDARTDVYAMGVMLYETLTGRLPFEADSVGELFVKIGGGDCVPLSIRRPDLDERWSELVHRAFHRDPAQRFESVEALRRELVQLAAGPAAARARTISDNVEGQPARGTLGYEERLPPPPRNPDSAATLAERSERPAAIVAPPASVGRASGEAIDDELEEGRAVSAPPAAPSAPRATPGWVWAAVGAAGVLAIVVLAQLSSSPPSPATGSGRELTAAPEAPAPTPPPAAERQPEPSPVVATTTDAGAPSIETPPAGRSRRSSRTTGLDPNPYR